MLNLTNEIFLKKDILSELCVLKQDIKNLISSSRIHLFNSEFLTSDAVLFNNKKTSNIRKSLSNVILRHFLKAEEIAPGAGQTLLLNWIQRDVDVKHAKVRQPTLNDFKILLSREVQDDVIRNILEEALTLVGFNGKIQVENSQSETYVIEAVRGHTFNLKHAFRQNLGQVYSPYVVVIDGFIEGVHEINLFLEEAAQSKEPVLLFVRGASEEVLNTLSVNLKRNTLNIHPFIVPYDVDNVNTLKDLAVVSGTDMISSFKGEILTTMSLKKQARVPSASVWSDKVSIVSDASSLHGIKIHSKELIEKRDECTEEFAQKLYASRLETMNSSHVIMRLPKNTSVSVKQSIDRFLRGFKCLLTHGVIDDDSEWELAARRLVVANLLPKLESSLNDLGAVIIM